MLVSIIIPVYNVEKYIDDCLQSVLGQTYSNLEVICVDDCGNDNSVAICEKYASEDSRVNIVKHEFNKGLPGARNTGLKLAKGEYVYFIDSDDMLGNNDAIEALVKESVHSESDIVTGRVLHWYSDGSTTEDYLAECQKKSFSGRKFIDVPEFCSHVVAWHKLIKREFLEKNSIYFIEYLKKHEDNPFTTKAFFYSDKISFVKDSLLLYRQRGDSDTTSIMSIDDEEYNAKYKFLCYKEIYEFLSEFPEENYTRNLLFYEASKTLSDLVNWKFKNITQSLRVEYLKELGFLIRKVSGQDFNYIFFDCADFSSFLHRHGVTDCEKFYFRKHPRLNVWQLFNLFFLIFYYRIFDPGFYIRYNPEVMQKDRSPTLHYLLYGLRRGLAPNKCINDKLNKLPHRSSFELKIAVKDYITNRKSSNVD
ncbi:glycosyltransferase family 2 protein [Saliniradius amylolyticus]|nr:glycosyltransferase family 2 protein [Saliniradius amylolyticus]